MPDLPLAWSREEQSSLGLSARLRAWAFRGSGISCRHLMGLLSPAFSTVEVRIEAHKI
jgi:hypothetical protein